MKFDLTPVVSLPEQLLALERFPSLQFHVKFDTGMRRLGFAIQDANEIASTWKESGRITGICTHFHSGEAKRPTDLQILEFKKALSFFQPFVKYIHAHNSAALLRCHAENSIEFNWGSRPGIALYGYTEPYATADIRPVLQWRTRIARCHHLAAGESVSYNQRWVAQRPSIVGVLPVGYADGYPRLLTNKGQVVIRGKTAPVIGTVCMDYILVDLTDFATGKPSELFEEWITLVGDGPVTAEQLAQQTATISYEILTGIGVRVPRRSAGQGGLDFV